MPLTDAEVAEIADWQSTHPGFGRDNAQTAVRVQEIADRLKSSGSLGCEIVKDDGLSNYFVLFAYIGAEAPSYPLERKVDGLLIYLSACAPVGVVGRSRKCVGPGLSSHDPLRIDTLLAPNRPSDHLEEEVFQAIRSSGYELLTPEEVSKPLPQGVKPFDYCHSPEPWDRVFHALFGDTD